MNNKHLIKDWKCPHELPLVHSVNGKEIFCGPEDRFLTKSESKKYIVKLRAKLSQLEEVKE